MRGRGNAVLRIQQVYHGSQILIFIHPGSRIPDLTTKTKEGGRGQLLVYLFCSHQFHKIENHFIFEQVRKKFQPTDK
jgi:hypothetical protein